MQSNQTGQLSAAARQRFARLEGNAPLTSDWLHTVMIHYAVAPERLQPFVPFELDTRDGRAYVSLVAFNMRRLRPTRFERLGAVLFAPIGNHPFLNVRTYVRDGNETGIYFLTEYLSNPISVPLGPPVFGLPYRWGRIDYQNEPTECGHMRGCVCMITAYCGGLANVTACKDSSSTFTYIDNHIIERRGAHPHGGVPSPYQSVSFSEAGLFGLYARTARNFVDPPPPTGPYVPGAPEFCKYFFLNDSMGNVRAMVDPSGNVQYQVYDAFGNEMGGGTLMKCNPTSQRMCRLEWRRRGYGRRWRVCE